jgi:plasmid maintenance system killer protein
MEISAKDGRLKAALEDESICKRRYGADMAKKIFLRIGALRAADSLFDFWPPKSGPERCHELLGDLTGTFSMDLKQPFRLLFVPVEHESGSKDIPDEQAKWKSITSVEILEVEDTHG